MNDFIKFIPVLLILLLSTIFLVSAEIAFLAPTPSNNTNQSETNVEINISITEPNLENMTFNFNGTNFSYYDNNLVLMYNFDNVSDLGENDTNIFDSSQSENNGTWQNTSITYVEGRYGRGIDFNGSVGNFINVSPVSNLDFDTGNYTIAFWVKLNKSNLLYFFDSRTGVGGQYGYTAYTSNGDIFFGQKAVGGSTQISNINSFSTSNFQRSNEWHYLTFVKTNSTYKGYNIFFDGELKHRLTISNVGDAGDITMTNLKIGAKFDDTYRFNGSMDEFRIWDHALSSEEIQGGGANTVENF